MRRRAVLCLAPAVLLVLQFGLLGYRELSTSRIATASTSITTLVGTPASDGTASSLLSMLRGDATDDESSSSSIDLDATVAAAAAAAAEKRIAASNGTGSKRCGAATDPLTEFPRNRILIIHEQHLQSMGCDVRLLRFVKDLLYLNQEVSMLFRGSTPSKMRQPKSRQLAQILHIENFEEEQLRKGLRKPPGIYEWTSAERFSQLMAMGYFNVVVIFLWFWYDPQPSVAELVLPLLRAHAPPHRQPFVAVLSDDAHSIRCARPRARGYPRANSRPLALKPVRSCHDGAPAVSLAQLVAPRRGGDPLIDAQRLQRARCELLSAREAHVLYD